jgi:hypothetical protein
MQAALRHLQSQSNPFAPGRLPSGSSATDTPVLAVPAVIHYTFALSTEQLADPHLRRQLHALQSTMALHIQRRNALNQPYLIALGVRGVSLTGELYRLARRDVDLISTELLANLVASACIGPIPHSERDSLDGILYALMKAGTDVSVFTLEHKPSSPSLIASPTKSLFPYRKSHTKSRSRSESRSIHPAMVQSVIRTASSSSGIIIDSALEATNSYFTRPPPMPMAPTNRSTADTLVDPP